MNTTFLDRIFFPEIELEGLEEYFSTMKSTLTYSNTGSLSQNLSTTLHKKLKLPNDFKVTNVSNGHQGIEAIGLLLKKIEKSQKIVICDIGFASQWHFVDQHFKEIIILSADQKYCLDTDLLTKSPECKDCDVVYITATYGQDISQELIKIRKHLPNAYIIADCANALFTSKFVADKNIFYMVSLHATKLFGIGEGGIILHHDSWDKKIKRSINFGINPTDEIEQFSTNAKMSEISAAIALNNIPLLDQKMKKLKNSMALYKKHIPNSLAEIYGETTLMCKFKTKKHLETAHQILQNNNISTHNMYLQEIPTWIKNKNSTKILKESFTLKETSLGLPFHTFLTEEHIAIVANTLREL